MNINRIAYLIRNEWTIKWKLYSMILVGATIYSFINFNNQGNLSSWLSIPDISTTFSRGSSLTISTLTPFFTAKSQLYHLDFMPPLFVTIGVVIISLVFWEYRQGSTSNFHISLPASQNEKWLAKFLFAIVLYPAVFFLAYQIYQSITHSMALSSSGKHITTMGVFDSYRWQQMLLGTLDLMIFFGLASIFRTYGFIKSIIVAAIGLNLIHFIPNLVIGLQHPQMLSRGLFAMLTDTDSYINFRINWSTVISSYEHNHWLNSGLFTIIPAFISVLFSYFKFKEIEA